MGSDRAGHETESTLGVNVPRQDARDKTAGKTRFTDDFVVPGMLYAATVNSKTAHGLITAIDSAEAVAMPGVRGVFTGEDFPERIGLYLGDKPALAVERVRYFGEPVVAVVADDERTALAAAATIRVHYEELPVVRGPREGIAPTHQFSTPKWIPMSIYRPFCRNRGAISLTTRACAKVTRSARSRTPMWLSKALSDFLHEITSAMEPRIAIAEIRADDTVVIRTSTQSPYGVRGIMSNVFQIPPGKLIVQVAEIGGGFGGKAGIQLEPLAYLLSRSLGGRPVRVANSREQDMLASPGGPGLEATVKFAARSDGTITAAEIEFLFDSGGYADYAVNVSRAAGYASTGPYRIPNLKTDSYCVYTNHPFATAYRGFGHIEMSYAVEREWRSWPNGSGSTRWSCAGKTRSRRGTKRRPRTCWMRTPVTCGSASAGWKDTSNGTVEP